MFFHERHLIIHLMFSRTCLRNFFKTHDRFHPGIAIQTLEIKNNRVDTAVADQERFQREDEEEKAPPKKARKRKRRRRRSRSEKKEKEKAYDYRRRLGSIDCRRGTAAYFTGMFSSASKTETTQKKARKRKKKARKRLNTLRVEREGRKTESERMGAGIVPGHEGDDVVY